MKRILLVLALLISGVSFGELKHFLPRTNAYHSVETMKLFFEGDTLIEGNLYIKLYSYNLQKDEEADFSKAIYCGAIREDTLNERYYFYSHPDKREYLVCDFSLKVGDTVKIWSAKFPAVDLGFRANAWCFCFGASDYQIPIIVDSIDSVLIDGNYRKRLLMDTRFNIHPPAWNNPLKTSQWIEGIGSNAGILWGGVRFAGMADVWDPYLLCVHENNQLIYQPFDTPCYLPYSISTESIKSEIQFSIYPTATTKMLYIECTRQKIGYYSIISIMGTGGKIKALQGNEINVSDLGRGMYVLQVYNGQKRLLGMRKFVKL